MPDTFLLSQQAIDDYLNAKQNSGVSAVSIEKYRTPLNTLHNWLGENNKVSAKRLLEWRECLEQYGYSKYSVQSYVKVINNFLRTSGYAHLCMPKPLRSDLTGKTFGYLTVLGITGERHKRSIMWHCQCKCGNEVDVPTVALLNGRTTSCGCLKTEILLHNNRYVEGTELRQALRDEPLNPNNSSGYTGVQPKGDKWIAYITYKKKKYHLGTFYKLDDAVKARAQAKELVMEDAQRLYDLTNELYSDKPQKPPKPEKPKKVSETKATAATAKRNDNTSGYTGVTKQYGKWNASIMVAGFRYKLGAYEQLEDAVAIRKQAEKFVKDGDLETLKTISTNTKLYK